MATISFMVNGATMGQDKSKVWVTIEEIEGGLLFFKVKQIGGSMGDLRGLYFDVVDESILNTLRIDTVSNDIRVSENELSHLRNGTNMNESFSAGEDGTSSYSFTLRSNARALALGDFVKIELDCCGTPDKNTNDDDSHRWLYMGLV